MTRFQGKYPARFVEVLWFLYQKRGISIGRLAAALRTNEHGIRGLFNKAGFRADRWTETELQELHAEYLAGAYLSELAKRRRRRTGELLALFQERGWKMRERTKFTFEKRRWPADLVAAMHADHLAGMGFSDLERKYGRGRQTIPGVFRHRGLKILKRSSNHKLANGCFAPAVPKTEEEIEAMIQAAHKLYVPEELKLDWRKWDLARRGDFIRRLRAKLASPLDRPQTPFSSNLKPFDYASPEAWEIVNAGNAGLTSRSAAFNLKIPSQGVIYDGRLWFWSGKGRGYFEGKWRPEGGRPSLHHHLYRKHHGSIPHHHAVILADGNFNNLDPSNLVLRSRNEICRENQASAITRKSREKMEILLARTERKNQDHDLLANLTH